MEDNNVAGSKKVSQPVGLRYVADSQVSDPRRT